ncbi:MAG TPA: capsule assembly Wzi family protein, partial [Gammaproteobacteria bacterium]
MLASAAGARGVSPYLPLHQSPDIERKIERLMILAGRPVMTRPIPAAVVLDALPTACERAPALCAEVRRYLSGYMRTAGIGHLEVDVAAAGDEAVPLPNRHGMASDSGYEVTGSVYWQPQGRWIVNIGMQAYDGETTPTGTMISAGSQYAQVDVGFRDHWFSPLTDASMLIGTQAPTMPSLTVSNYEPISRFGFRYEVFFAQMSESQSIQTLTGPTTGEPVLSGVHLSIEPFPGWSVGINRIMQFGGGERDESLRDWFNAFFNPSKNDNTGTPADFGNQAASFTTSFVWPGVVPGAVYFEYAGEDTSNNNSLRLGNSALSAGVFLPQLGGRFDLTVEASEWQNGWYEHHVYL